MDVIEAIRARRSIGVFSNPTLFPGRSCGSCWTLAGGHHREEMSSPGISVLAGKSLAEVTARFVQKAKTWDGREYTNTNSDLPRTDPYPKFPVPRRQALQDAVRYRPSTRDLEARQLEHRVHMLRFFAAPSVILVCGDDRGPNSRVSVGGVTQTICLAAPTYGLGTCIMGIPVLWPEIFRESLSIPETEPS